MINMFNKIDLIGGEPGVRRDQYGRIQDVYASAETKDGLDLLKKAISEQKVLREKCYYRADGLTRCDSQSAEGDDYLEGELLSETRVIILVKTYLSVENIL